MCTPRLHEYILLFPLIGSYLTEISAVVNGNQCHLTLKSSANGTDY